MNHINSLRVRLLFVCMCIKCRMWSGTTKHSTKHLRYSRPAHMFHRIRMCSFFFLYRMHYITLKWRVARSLECMHTAHYSPTRQSLSFSRSNPLPVSILSYSDNFTRCHTMVIGHQFPYVYFLSTYSFFSALKLVLFSFVIHFPNDDCGDTRNDSEQYFEVWMFCGLKFRIEYFFERTINTTTTTEQATRASDDKTLWNM